MKAFAAAVVFSIVVAFGASSVLNGSFQTPSSAKFSTEGAAVTNPGSNLIQY
jgi:hypothetical protein